MKIAKLNIPIFDHKLTWIQIESKVDANNVRLRSTLTEINFDNEAKADVIGKIERDEYNGGDTYRNGSIKQIAVIIYRCTTIKQLINTINHEKRHAVDRVLEYCGVEDEETAAYIDGYISEQLVKLYKDYLK